MDSLRLIDQILNDALPLWKHRKEAGLSRPEAVKYLALNCFMDPTTLSEADTQFIRRQLRILSETGQFE
jgi:hypothetical protein